jgi:hypothetical protein
MCLIWVGEIKPINEENTVNQANKLIYNPNHNQSNNNQATPNESTIPNNITFIKPKRPRKPKKPRVIMEPHIQRDNNITIQKRGRGRPKKDTSKRIIPLVDKSAPHINFNTTHPALKPYQELVNRVFSDPNSGRPYVVTFIFFHAHKKIPVAYRRSLDDFPPDPYDEFPFEKLDLLSLFQLLTFNFIVFFRRIKILFINSLGKFPMTNTNKSSNEILRDEIKSCARLILAGHFFLTVF